MTPADIRKLADDCGTRQTRYVAPQAMIALLALADVVEAGRNGPCRHSASREDCSMCDALASVAALKP